MLALGQLFAEGFERKLFTDAALHVVTPEGEFETAAGEGSGLFDVASLTKVFTAALAVSKFSLEHRLEWLKVRPTVGDLLAHRTGLPAWRPFFAMAAGELGRSPRALVASGTEARTTVPEARALVRRAIAVEEAQAPRPTYSDLNFLALGFELEDRLGAPLPELARKWLLEPFQLTSTRWGGVAPEAAITGSLRPRPWSPDPSLALASEPSDDRAIDDDNAAVMGGVCGHAGIWSTARDVARLGAALLERSDAEPWRALFEQAGGGRTYGLDTPTGAASSIGSILGRGPLGAAGHLGFTGCSLWIDRDARASIALLTNAAAFERPAVQMRAWRRDVHDAVARLLG